jgi:hypothetical protein
LPGENQAILFWVRPNEVAILRFSPVGEYLGEDVRKCPPLPNLLGQPDQRSEAVHDHFRDAFGFAPGLVRVKRFFADHWQVGIRPVEWFHDEFAADPATFCSGDQEEATDELDSLRSWVEEGQFVFDCGNSYWVNDCGTVFSS